MPNPLSELPDISKLDENKPYFIDGKCLRAIVQTLNDLWAGRNIGKGPNIRIRQTGTGGYTITGADQTSDAYKVALPFQVTISGNVDDGYMATVNKESDLLLSLEPDDNLEITGLDTPFEFTPDDDLIWLQVTIADGVATAATIQGKTSDGDNFDPTATAYDDSDMAWIVGNDATPPDPVEQTMLNVLIAFTSTDDDDNDILVQACSTHLVLDERCINGHPSLIALPSPYRRYTEG